MLLKEGEGLSGYIYSLTDRASVDVLYVEGLFLVSDKVSPDFVRVDCGL
jgi:hypothetical protein